ncbi:hypothetical protein SB4_05875 [Sphingomonas sanguinis]|uniref:Uncharacterized protein n=1 Tax=Sphingomonas sanguinis TaxID=33051 RepID=A0A147J072_9SPHN|nr:hypothetical protein SB4_05875 [Sphingomonas sanguinis]
MASGQMQDATPLRRDHHRNGRDGRDQRARENQNTHHDHHDVRLLPDFAVRHINPTVTIQIFVKFRHRIRDSTISRANSTSLRWRYATINLHSLL